MTKKIILILIVSIAIFSVAEAEDVGVCKTIQYKEGRVYMIKSALYMGTHITLPERLMLDPVAGNNLLWTVEGNGHHVMVQPNSAEKQGFETTLTLITESNASFNFILRRVKENPDTCVTIKITNKFFKGTKKTSYKTPRELENMLLEKRIEGYQQQLKEQRDSFDRRIDEVLRKYRSFVYTRYKWTKGEGFKGADLVSDVYDDGRFTFIRVVADQRGVLAVSAEIDGKQEMLEYKLDSDNIYKISGIYPKFELKYGASSVKIIRKDNRSNGVY
jgi:type IV secretory pathway VirB9-like protein